MPSRPLLAWAVFATASLAAMPAIAADEKAQCVAASEKAQQLRNANKLIEARDQLAICGRSECPKLVTQDCTEWMKELIQALPSVVPGAKDRKNRDIVDVKVSIDGKVVTDTLDGKPIHLDPGVHAFKFETKGAPTIEEQVVIRVGEKNRILTVTFATPDSGGNDKEKDKDKDKGKGGNQVESSPPIAAYVVGGLGLAALGVALYLAIDADSDARSLRDTCAPRCDQGAVDDVKQQQVIAGVTAGIGGAALIAGVVMFFLHNRGDAKSGKAQPPPIMVAPLPGGGTASALVRF